MTTSTHIQRIGLRRSTVVAAVAAMTLGLAAAALPSTGLYDGGSQKQPRVHAMPHSGCGGGCRAA